MSETLWFQQILGGNKPLDIQIIPWELQDF